MFALRPRGAAAAGSRGPALDTTDYENIEQRLLSSDAVSSQDEGDARTLSLERCRAPDY